MITLESEPPAPKPVPVLEFARPADAVPPDIQKQVLAHFLSPNQKPKPNYTATTVTLVVNKGGIYTQYAVQDKTFEEVLKAVALQHFMPKTRWGKLKLFFQLLFKKA